MSRCVEAVHAITLPCSETRLERHDKTDTHHSPIKSVDCSMNQEYAGTNLKNHTKINSHLQYVRKQYLYR